MSFSKVYTTAFFLRAKIQQMVLATMDSAEAQRQKNSAEALSEEKISWNDEDFSKVYTTAFFLRAKIQQMVLATMDSAEAQRQKNSAEALSEEKISWNDEDQLVHKDGSAGA
ncbi:hypothetical protein F511_44232 [Dorcoceras hygrometricum]|uniref:Uncharacterized protein n=1 Tax=Dorcoceras hygrometricum TaxID=472368 RepID=A0A2Z7BB12_9LAMI|nr:hypothetical protein F511_44232 [Dorcoceras hygrometricum]